MFVEQIKLKINFH